MWKSVFSGKSVLITGVCGTIGSELLQQLLAMDVKFVRGIDNNEEILFYLTEHYRKEDRFEGIHTDITYLPSVNTACNGIDIVLHAAALKQVPVCEVSPDSAVQTNIVGVQNIITAARNKNVERVLFTSSDKAVNPTNVMGTTKLMGERLITAANAGKHPTGPIFASTRFGNVAGSKGSVIPLFRRQIEKGGPITLTSNEMTRFMMTVEEACNLVLKSAAVMRGGEVFVTKMPVVAIEDIAKVMIDELAKGDIEIVETGPRPGEKMYEELTTGEETRRTFESKDLLIILPAFHNLYSATYIDPSLNAVPSNKIYNSEYEPKSDFSWIKDLLIKIDVL